MRKTMVLAEIREMFGVTCYEIGTGFLVNDFGKYKPNVSFLVGKEFELDAAGKPIGPLTYVSDREVTDNMGIDFGGKEVAFMFGEFWRSKRAGLASVRKTPRRPRTS